MRGFGHRAVAVVGLVGLFLAGQLGGLIHNAVTPHVRCADHGKQVHASAAHTDELVRVFDISHHSRSYRAGSDSPHGDAHDHCSLPVGGGDRVVAKTQNVSANANVWVQVAVGPSSPTSTSKRRSYLIAPKQSPPA